MTGLNSAENGTAAAAPAIECRALAFAYPGDAPVLRGIDLAIPAGERMAIVGRNGSGKSTLVRTWNGLLRPAAGEVRVEGVGTVARRVADLARVVGMTFQDPDRQLFGATCRDEVAFGARNVGVRDAELDTVVESALAAAGLGHAAGKHPYDLGGSWRRLLAIASVLAMRTPIIVLDEPTMGLDARQIDHVRSIVDDLATAGRTIVAVSHDARFIEDSFARVVRIEEGRLVDDGRPSEVLP
ncbi:MAG TPA: ABC transporter ATP-binding protein [Candidatus Limnocylindria bacterium]|nr:ABC transporter ATP-binding protein [Candidatus Limnocylindria bacterium]